MGKKPRKVVAEAGTPASHKPSVKTTRECGQTSSDSTALLVWSTKSKHIRHVPRNSGDHYSETFRRCSSSGSSDPKRRICAGVVKELVRFGESVRIRIRCPALVADLHHGHQSRQAPAQLSAIRMPRARVRHASRAEHTPRI